MLILVSNFTPIIAMECERPRAIKEQYYLTQN